MTQEELKLECLKIAITTFGGSQDSVKYAQKMYDFISDVKQPQEEEKESDVKDSPDNS